MCIVRASTFICMHHEKVHCLNIRRTNNGFKLPCFFFIFLFFMRRIQIHSRRCSTPWLYTFRAAAWRPMNFNSYRCITLYTCDACIIFSLIFSFFIRRKNILQNVCITLHTLKIYTRDRVRSLQCLMSIYYINIPAAAVVVTVYVW